MLDGVEKLDNAVLTTTNNYPEKLEARVIGRPSWESVRPDGAGDRFQSSPRSCPVLAHAQPRHGLFDCRWTASGEPPKPCPGLGAQSQQASQRMAQQEDHASCLSTPAHRS
jgi:hypothetical protein